MKVYFYAGEVGANGAWVGGNYLATIDGSIYAGCPIPEGEDEVPEDYGYMVLKNAILAAYHGAEPLEFWYDGQEESLSPAAWEGEVTDIRMPDD